MSPVQNYNAHGNLSSTEDKILHAAFEMWMDAIDTDPLLLLGMHRSDLGLTVIPIQNDRATTADVIAILEDALAYIKAADPESAG